MELIKPVVNDFGGAPFAEHNMPCAVCWKLHAILDLSSGRFEPCRVCQRHGWRLVKLRMLPWTWLYFRWKYRGTTLSPSAAMAYEQTVRDVVTSARVKHALEKAAKDEPK